MYDLYTDFPPPLVPRERRFEVAERVHDKPGEIRLSPDQALVVETPGAGGYGPPAERSAEAQAEDRASGKFTAELMRRHYGCT